MVKIGERIDYLIGNTWMTGIVRDIKNINDDTKIYFVRDDDEIFCQQLFASEIYIHNNLRFQTNDTGCKVKWVKCTKDNYWSDDPNILTIVKVTISNELMTFTEKNCPYGWNVLCRTDAYKTDIILTD